MTKIIHVNKQFIAMNAKDGGNRPVIILREGSKPTRYSREIIIHGPSKMVNDGSQLSCGARVYLETDSEVTLVGECSFQEAKNYDENNRKETLD